MKQKKSLYLLAILLIGIVVLQKNFSTKPTSKSTYATQVDINRFVSSDPDIKDELSGTVNIIAENNAFNPNSINIPHLKTVILHIYASDKNYTFNVKDFNIQEVIPQGQTVDVKVSGLGVGTFPFDCGIQCVGTINVRQETDQE